MDQIYERIETLITNAKKGINRPYTAETIEAKKEELDGLQREVEKILGNKEVSDSDITSHTKKFGDLRTYAIETLNAHLSKQRKVISPEPEFLSGLNDSEEENTTSKINKQGVIPKTITMAHLDLNELSTISKLVPIFNGKRDELQNFITNIELVNETIPAGKTQPFFSFIFKSKLDLKVQNRIKQQNTPTTITELVNLLKSSYRPLRTANSVLNELTKIVQKGSNLMGFASKIEMLVTELNEVQIAEQGEANKASIVQTNNSIAFNSFINGLKDAQTLATIDASQVTTFSEALAIAEKIDSRAKQAQVLYQTSRGNNRDRNSDCGKCGRKHGDRCPAMGMKCNKCGRENHFASKCYSKKTTITTAEITIETIGLEVIIIVEITEMLTTCKVRKTTNRSPEDQGLRKTVNKYQRNL